MIKKLLALTLAFLMIFTFVACDKGENPSSADNTASGDQTSSNTDSSDKTSSSTSSAKPSSSDSSSEKKPSKIDFVPIRNANDYFQTKNFYSEQAAEDIEYMFHEPIRKTGKDYPLFIFLHGLNEPMNLSSLGTANPLIEAFIWAENAREEHSTYMLIPSTPLPSEGWWTDAQLSALKDLLDKLIKEYNIDEKRIYLSGISMGGFVTCQLVDQMPPDTFAAAITFSGASNMSNPQAVQNTAFAIYHAEGDTTVNPYCSRALNEQLVASGHKKVSLTVFEGGDHLSPIKSVFVYNSTAFFEWLFAQKLP